MHNTKLLITGATGLLGANFVHTALDAGWAPVGVALPCRLPQAPAPMHELDLRDAAAAAEFLEAERPGLIVHLAALTNVDWCEDHSEEAFAFNAGVSGKLAALAAQRGIRFVYMSTDSVFDGERGGYTESAKEAWGHDVPYLQSVADFTEEKTGVAPHPEDEAAWTTYFKTMKELNCLRPRYANPQAFRWVVLLKRKELEANLGTANGVGTVLSVTPVHRGASGRITALRIDGTTRSVTIEKELAIRRVLGNLRSSAFTLDAYCDDNNIPVVFALWGAGWGHGIGMCQVGAVGLAEQGWTYDKILAYYYKGVSVEAR